MQQAAESAAGRTCCPRGGAASDREKPEGGAAIQLCGCHCFSASLGYMKVLKETREVT